MYQFKGEQVLKVRFAKKITLQISLLFPRNEDKKVKPDSVDGVTHFTFCSIYVSILIFRNFIYFSRVRNDTNEWKFKLIYIFLIYFTRL